MRDLTRDLRFGLRSLGRAPGFAAAAVATLALGIGASAAHYSFVDEFLLPQRALSVTTGVLALGALLLSAVGIYGVVGQFVSRRTREIGIRMAVGASRGSVVHLVLGRGLHLALIGVAGGVAAAAAAGRLLQGLLFGIGALDPLSFAGGALFLVGIAVLAAWLPARRASRVDPLVALRCE